MRLQVTRLQGDLNEAKELKYELECEKSELLYKNNEFNVELHHSKQKGRKNI